MSINKEFFIKNFVDEMKAENAAVFAGAGLSIPAGLVNWKGMIAPLAKELNLDINREHDLIAIAQYHYNSHGQNKGYINQHLINTISNIGEITPNHQILAKLPIKTYWTTNYDKLLEDAFKKIHKIADVKHTVKQLANTVPNRDVVLYKMHGDVDMPDDAVVTKDDYERYHLTMTPFINALTGDLISKTFLFIGFSFQDPNLDYILSRVRLALMGSQRRHYCIIKTVARSEYEKNEDYEYNKLKQTYLIEDLKRFNIQTVLVNDYSEITEILQELETRLKQKAIFISSAISDYSHFAKDEVESLLKKLSGCLIVEGYTIVTGYGLGVGNAIIFGALDEIYVNGKGNKEQLEIKPFPQSNHANTKQVWTQHRKTMISNCGVAIFLFGNIIDDKGQVINSPGMREEFEIAKSNNAYLLPVGETGYMAKELYDETLASYEKYNSNYNMNAKSSFQLLKDDSTGLTNTVDKIMTVLNSIK